MGWQAGNVGAHGWGIRYHWLVVAVVSVHEEQVCELRQRVGTKVSKACGEEQMRGRGQQQPSLQLLGTQPDSPVPSQGVRDQLPSGNADLQLLCSVTFQSQCVLECVSNQNYPSSLFSKISSCYLLSRNASDFSVV